MVIFHRDQNAGDEKIAPLCQRGEMEPEGSTTTTTTILPTTATPALTTTTPDGVSECPEGWSKNQTSCYWMVFLSFDHASWAEAKQRCPQFHPAAHLASSGSELENDFITHMHSGTETFWLGGTDSDEEGNWTWTDGTPFNYTKWESYEGAGGIKQNCLAIRLSYYGYWYDYECFDSYPYICEINLDN